VKEPPVPQVPSSQVAIFVVMDARIVLHDYRHSPWLVKVRTASIRGPRMIHSAYLGPLMPFAGVSPKGRWRWYRRGGVHA